MIMTVVVETLKTREHEAGPNVGLGLANPATKLWSSADITY